MKEDKSFDSDEMMDELSSRLEDMLEDMIEDAVTCAVQDAIPEAFVESLSDFEFVLKDGTIVRPKQHMKVFSPDKAKLLICYGGLRVDGSSLMIQTRISSWENIAYYPSREEAIEALKKVKHAMESDVSIFEL
ncbi:MAG: hypothetical protein IKD37_04525 [Clostridia bacterium]|nr:hypothetical protein [Clostridia bacterium]